MVRRLRWRLARLVAPEPIMADTYPDAEAFVVVRSKRGSYPSWAVTHSLDEVSIETSIEPLTDFTNSDLAAFRPPRRRTRVTATGPA